MKPVKAPDLRVKIKTIRTGKTYTIKIIPAYSSLRKI